MGYTRMKLFHCRIIFFLNVFLCFQHKGSLSKRILIVVNAVPGAEWELKLSLEIS